MFCKTCITALCLAAVATIGIAAAQPGKDKAPAPAAPTAPAGDHGMQLPPGWTEADMKACMDSATPGKMHEWLAKSVGTWQGKEQMWMAPETPAMTTECTQTVTSVMDGRFIQCTFNADMMGQPFVGMGTTGFDNVTQKFVSTWFDNMGTGIMSGTGELSSDQKKLTITFMTNCPVRKKAVPMREVLTFNSPTSHTLEMFTTDAKSGKEFKMLHIDFTKK